MYQISVFFCNKLNLKNIFFEFNIVERNDKPILCSHKNISPAQRVLSYHLREAAEKVKAIRIGKKAPKTAKKSSDDHLTRGGGFFLRVP